MELKIYVHGMNNLERNVSDLSEPTQRLSTDAFRHHSREKPDMLTYNKPCIRLTLIQINCLFVNFILKKIHKSQKIKCFGSSVIR